MTRDRKETWHEPRQNDVFVMVFLNTLLFLGFRSLTAYLKHLLNAMRFQKIQEIKSLQTLRGLQTKVAINQG